MESGNSNCVPSVQCGRMKETSGWYVDKAIHNHVYHDQFFCSSVEFVETAIKYPGSSG